MLGRKSKAEKEKELSEEVERELKSRKSKEEAERKLGECNKKFKKGATFKYLELNGMLRKLHVTATYDYLAAINNWRAKEYFVAVDAVYIRDGEILPLDIDVELLEALINL
ncbi:hypothetical protein KAR91_52530 [Candidatus Pacearchaeota archaeon]|nr:hypothetical protein [Candidatus Pacearchaeota archaeon]